MDSFNTNQTKYNKSIHNYNPHHYNHQNQHPHQNPHQIPQYNQYSASYSQTEYDANPNTQYQGPKNTGKYPNSVHKQHKSSSKYQKQPYERKGEKPYRNMNKNISVGQPQQHQNKPMMHQQQPIVEMTFLDNAYIKFEKLRVLKEEQLRRAEIFRIESLRNEMSQTSLVDDLQYLISTNVKEWTAKEKAFECSSKSAKSKFVNPKVGKSKADNVDNIDKKISSPKVVIKFHKSDDESDDDETEDEDEREDESDKNNSSE